MSSHPGTATSALACRALSVGAFVLALGSALLAVAFSPPFLERWILADHDLGPEVGKRAAWIVAAGLALVAVLAAALARFLGSRAESIPARRLRAAVLSLLSTTLLLGFSIEIYLRCTRSPEQVLSGDALWISRWNTGRPDGHDVLRLQGRLHRQDEELGWAPVSDYRQEGVTTNSRGLRGTKEHAVPKPPGRRRIVAVGDSFTWGLGVRDEDTWPALLQTLLRDVEVINLGVTAYGTDQQYLRLCEEGFRYEPDLVILGFFGPDADRNVLRFRDSAKPRFAIDDGRLRLESVERSELDPATSIDLGPFSYAGALVATKLRSAIDRTVLAPKWAVTRSIFDAVREKAREHGAELLVAHFPTEPSAFGSRPEDSELLLEEWAEERGEPIVRLREAFLGLAPAERPNVFHDHWSAFGNTVVARAIARAIDEHGLMGSPEPIDR